MAKATETVEKTTRQRRDPAQRAQADYDKAVKAHEKAQDRLQKLQDGINEASSEVERTQRYLDYASRNPDLPAQEAGDAPQPDASVTEPA
jgi:peptidoglycan hydrolase CwlO-like protein